MTMTKKKPTYGEVIDNMEQKTKRRLQELSRYLGKSKKLDAAMNTFIEYNVPLDEAHEDKFYEIYRHAKATEREIIRVIDKLYTESSFFVYLEEIEGKQLAEPKKVTVSPFRE